VQYAWDRHDRCSVLGALSLAPWALRIGLYFRLFDHNVTVADVVEFIKQLHRQLGRRLIVVWDRWSVHRAAARQLARYKWLQVEYLPAYAPELNPVEALWNHTKYGDLANFVPTDAEDLHQSIADSLNHQRADARLKYSCFRYAKINQWPVRDVGLNSLSELSTLRSYHEGGLGTMLPPEMSFPEFAS
jgi:transposase